MFFKERKRNEKAQEVNKGPLCWSKARKYIVAGERRGHTKEKRKIETSSREKRKGEKLQKKNAYVRKKIDPLKWLKKKKNIV